MNSIIRTRLGAYMLISTAILMLAFWTFFALFLPMKEPYINWILNDNWTWINLIGFIGSSLGIFAIYTLFDHLRIKSTIDYISLSIGIVGILILTSVLFFETFILKGIAIEEPEIINLNEGFYQYLPFKGANLAGGIFLSTGFILLGLRLIKLKTFKKWKIIILMLACPLFGIVYVPGNLRLAGVLLYTLSFSFIGLEILKQIRQSRSKH